VDYPKPAKGKRTTSSLNVSPIQYRGIWEGMNERRKRTKEIVYLFDKPEGVLKPQSFRRFLYQIMQLAAKRSGLHPSDFVERFAPCKKNKPSPIWR